MEHRLVPAGHQIADSARFFGDRPNVPHLDRPVHQQRLRHCAALVDQLVTEHGVTSIVDVGCGDGGLLSLLTSEVPIWGYDVRVDSVRNARPGTDVRHVDVLTTPVDLGDPSRGLVVATELFEHLDQPHEYARRLAAHAAWLVASSPAEETEHHHDHTHVWAWDMPGYHALFTGSGWDVASHQRCGWSQIVVARSTRVPVQP